MAGRLAVATAVAVSEVDQAARAGAEVEFCTEQSQPNSLHSRHIVLVDECLRWDLHLVSSK